MDKIKVFDGCFNPIKYIKNDDIFIVLTPEEKNVLMVTREKFNEVVPDTANENNKLTDKEYVDGIKTELDTEIATINSKIPSTASNTNKLTDKLYVDELVAAEQSRAENVEDLLDRSIDHEVERATTKETLLENAITTINSKIPSTATDTNKLVDKDFVDSIIDDINDSIDIIDEVTAEGLYNLNERKQDIIEDLETIRSGAALGETAYQKPQSGIPASDIANGVIPDVSQFITKSVNDLVNYYTKSLTYTQSEVNALIGSIQQFHYEIYASLQDITIPATNILYLIGPKGSGSDKYEEYVYANNFFTKIGDTTIDLSGYVTTQALNSALQQFAQELQNELNNYALKSEIKTVNGNSLVGSGNINIYDVFIVEYNVTTYQEILNAYNAGKHLILKYNIHGNPDDWRLLPLEEVVISTDGASVGTYGFTFSAIYYNHSFLCTIDIYGYSQTTTNLQQELHFDNTPTSGSTNPVTSAGIKTALDNKQDTLVSGTNIKTINNQSVLGSGNLDLKDVFIVKYDVTTYQEVLDAYNAGKYLVLKYNNHDSSDEEFGFLPLERVLLYSDGGLIGTYGFIFTTITYTKSISCVVELSGYSLGSTILQQALTFDNAPTANSNNPVKSSGIKTALDNKQNKIEDLSTIRSGAAAGATAYQKPQGGIPESDLTSELQQTIDNVPSILQSISAISDLVPEQASSSNQLADKNFVNSSIQTNTAEFKGTRNLVTDLSLTTSATQQQIAAALASAISSADNNDYCFVQIPTDDATPTQIARVDRYKYNGGAWLFEWSLNNSSFTAAQWASINSGIVGSDVTKLKALPTKPELDTLFAAKQDALVSGTNIKTINNQSVLGSGNLDLENIIIIDSSAYDRQVITTALNSGKTVFLRYSGTIYTYVKSATGDAHTFYAWYTNGGAQGLAIAYNIANDNVVYITNRKIQSYIDSTHKLDADLVDDTNSTHKFVTITFRQF